MEYCSIRQISENGEISVRRIRVLCVEKRIPSVAKMDIHGRFLRMLKKPKISE